MNISDAMHRTATWVPAESPVIKVARLMRDQDIGAVPVGKDDRLIGMITDRDLTLRVLAEGRDPAVTRAEEVMTRGIIYCSTHQSLEDAVYLMDQRQIRRLPVLDENKRLVGMLSMGDISHAVPRALTGELTQAVSAHHAERQGGKVPDS
jgi:CBS domain-containing protein